MRRVASVASHLGASSAAAQKPPEERDHTPGEHQPVARQLGVTYGPTRRSPVEEVTYQERWGSTS